MADSTRNVLLEAHELIFGDRQRDYGDPADNIGLIAQYWSVYLGLTVEPADVCNLMLLLKLAREGSGRNLRDTVIDQAGYVGLKDRIQAYSE